MNFWKKLFIDSKEDFKNKIVKSVFNRSESEFKYIHLENYKTQIKAFRIKTKSNYEKYLKFNNFQDYNIAYVLANKMNFNTFGLGSEIDVVVTDLSWEITDVFINFPVNKESKMFNHISNVFFFAKGTIKKLKLNLGLKLRPF